MNLQDVMQNVTGEAKENGAVVVEEEEEEVVVVVGEGGVGAEKGRGVAVEKESRVGVRKGVR